MSGRSPARFAAPIALVAAALAIYLIGFAGSVGEKSDEPPAAPAGQTTKKAPANARAKPGDPDPTKTGGDAPRATTGRTYTIKAGDVLSVISDETGVSIPDLMRLNPGLDARALQVGRKLRLSG